MNAMATPGMDSRWSSRGWFWPSPAPGGLPEWLASLAIPRVAALLACWVFVTAIGMAVNTSLHFPALRAHVALACAALASAIVLAERWSADPDRMARGCALATLAGAASACASLI